MQDRKQIKNTDNTQTTRNPEKAKKNKTTLVQSPFTTLGTKPDGLILQGPLLHPPIIISLYSSSSAIKL